MAVRTRTGQQTMDNILRERRLGWLGHVFRMDHSKHCTGRYQDTRENQVDQERTGGAQSAKMGFTWEEARWQLLTDTDGVGVWPNASSWIRDESRSRSRSRLTMTLCCLFQLSARKRDGFSHEHTRGSLPSMPAVIMHGPSAVVEFRNGDRLTVESSNFRDIYRPTSLNTRVMAEMFGEKHTTVGLFC